MLHWHVNIVQRCFLRLKKRYFRNPSLSLLLLKKNWNRISEEKKCYSVQKQGLNNNLYIFSRKIQFAWRVCRHHVPKVVLGCLYLISALLALSLSLKKKSALCDSAACYSRNLGMALCGHSTMPMQAAGSILIPTRCSRLWRSEASDQNVRRV